ncbi:MAG: rRNA maturation RNase YbeY [Anaerolineaceae bacterium]|nr:rRNA maturation RNase YbeY [Anaerolineaceae bacterium]
MITITISRKYKTFVDLEQLRIAAQTSIDILKPKEEYELTIAVKDDIQVRRLNKQYRQIDATTDVLSFEAHDLNPESGLIYLGDIIISYPKTLSQSITADHPVSSEIQLLVVHGMLHLFGYDHSEPEDKEKMWMVQKNILDHLGITINHYPED